ncbi:copper resistance protein B [Dyella soli]|uniref:Copper resistance protein B n=1 Tax=Dyella soli TaxID=522319 RepID=A0A4R0YL93_9GAMM|nr:copper resistance protein B [Dyella soli]TCI09597.1 copper resistance protein B [Dyella soli]
MRARLLSRHALAWALLAAMPASALAQSMGMEDMPGMSMPAHDTSPQPHAEKAPPQGHDHGGHAPATVDDHAVPGPAADAAWPPNGHVAPPPPQRVMPAMPPSQMTGLMQMDDAASQAMWSFDRLERSRSTNGDYATRWEAEGWWGGPVDRVWLKTEGEHDSRGTQDGRVEVLWSHAWTSFWDGQLGVRQDFGQGPQRQWLAAGVQGLAPYWFETQATFYVGEQGRTAARFEASYDVRFTQRLILEPRLELNAYGKDDPRRGISSGLSDLEAGLRLRYEISRKFAPYLGAAWTRRFGTADEGSAGAQWHAHETAWVAGVRWWF